MLQAGATARRAAFVQRCERNARAVVSIRRKALRFSALRRPFPPYAATAGRRVVVSLSSPGSCHHYESSKIRPPDYAKVLYIKALSHLRHSRAT